MPSSLQRALCKAGRPLVCPGNSNAIQLQFGAGQATLNFLLLPSTSLILLGCGSGAGR